MAGKIIFQLWIVFIVHYRSNGKMSHVGHPSGIVPKNPLERVSFRQPNEPIWTRHRKFVQNNCGWGWNESHWNSPFGRQWDKLRMQLTVSIWNGPFGHYGTKIWCDFLFDIMDARSIGYGTSMEQKFLLESIRMRCQWKWNGTHWKAPLRTSIPPFERQFENQTSFTKRSSWI